MQGFMKLSTAVNITLLMIDSSDHVTGKTGLSAGLTIYATKAAGTPGVITPTVTELDSTNVKGLYKLAFTSSHTDTLGELQIHVTASGADPTDITWQVATYLPGEAATLQADQAVNATKWAGGTIPAPNVTGVPLVDDKYLLGTIYVTPATAGIQDINVKNIANAAVDTTVAQIGVNAVKWVGGVIPAVNVTGVPLIDLKYTLGTISPATAGSVRADAVTGAVGSVTGAVGSVTGAVGSVTGAVGSVTGNVGGNVVGSVASVTARVTANTDQLAGQTVTAAAGVTFPTSVASPTNITAGTITTATNLTNAPTAGDFTATMKTSLNAATPAVTVSDKTGFSLSAGGVQAIWDALTSALTTAGSIGKWIVDKLDVVLSTRLATSGYTAPPTAAANATAVRTELTTELGRIDVAVSTRLAAAGYTAPLDATGTRSAVGLATANLDTQLGAIAGYIDTEVGAIKAKTDNLPASPAAVSDIPTAAAIADQVWDELTAGHAISGSTGEALTNAGAAGTPPTAAQNASAVWDAVRASHTTAGSFGQGAASVQGNVTGSVASVSGAVGSVTGNVGGNVAGSVASVTADVGITQAGADKVWASAARTLTSFGTLVADIATAVWGAATRVLTAGTNIVLAKGVGVTGFNDLSAAQVNTEADTALSDAGVTTVRMAHLDADVSSRLASGSYTAPDNADIVIAAAAAASAATNAATLVGRLTSGRALLLDNLDAAISTRAVAGDAMALTAVEREAIADAWGDRNIGGGSNGGRTNRDALRPLRNKTSIVGGTLTVMEEDDTTPAWTAAVTTSPGDPLSAIDPA